MRWYVYGQACALAPYMYDCMWQVMNNFALLDIELERESFILF